MANQDVVSLFAGCGGLDLGFSQAGFNIVWANENDKDIWDTYILNHENTILDKRSIINIDSNEMPKCIGIIGGPPCQSWSEAGAKRGINDSRGELFFEYIRILRDKQPLFFLAENVPGMLAPRHNKALTNIIDAFEDSNYNVFVKLLNAKDYNTPQDRKRLIFVGYHKNLKKKFRFPIPLKKKLTLKDAIWDLSDTAIPALEGNKSNNNKCSVSNHEYMIGGFSSIYMSRNRVRSWEEQSFTIQAGGRHAPLHPQANKMIKIEKDKCKFDENTPEPYRRLSVREIANIQTFPNDFVFKYENLNSAYKMIGNAVPVNFAFELAKVIYNDLFEEKYKNIQLEEHYSQNVVSKQLNFDLV